jgi:glycosyltransferase involved in cell wall biosynthesis
MPSGGIFVLLNYAKILDEAGYDVRVIYEPREDRKASYEASQKSRKVISIYEKFNPIWAGDFVSSLNIMPLGDGEIKFVDKTVTKAEILNLGPEDFIFIPEGFPNVMEQTAQIPCKKIVLCQSWYYILNGLRVGQNWQQYNIQDVISVSEGITEYLNAIMPGLKIKELKQSIDRDLFKPVSMVDKKPIIAYQPGRSQDAALKTANVIKTFYSFFPHYRWVRFVELQNLSKKEYAERIGESAFVLYTDEIAGFGTLPLEAMASGTHVIGWTPLGSKEYINENNGYWCTNGDIFRLAEMIGLALDAYLSGSIDDLNMQNVYDNLLQNYTKENEKETILNLQKEYENERITEFTKFKK